MEPNKLPEEGVHFNPTDKDTDAINLVLKDFIKGRSITQKSYAQFNGRNLYDCIDDWTKRWNGYIPEASPLLDSTQSQIFLNYTRNAIISYLVKVALGMPSPKIIAVNKKLNTTNRKFAEVLTDMNQYSLNAENGEARFFESALEVTTKGTVIKYEGYSKQEEEIDVPETFDAVTGELRTKKEKKVIYDDCYQEIVPIEDFYISNPYQPDVQKQPFVIWRRLTTIEEARTEFGHYKNFEYVRAGQHTVTADPTTFYRNSIATELGNDQVEILRYYNRTKQKHIILINGVPVYIGAIPFKDGKYPFAKGIYEPAGNDFFWGLGFPNKIQGEQDLKNMFFNMAVDKATGALLPYGLTSDLDDIIEDEVLAPNKIRKVGDINKWKIDVLPGLSSSDVQMIQLIDKNIGENSGSGTGPTSSPRGGKLAARQILLQQQETMQKLGFSMNFLEDFERDRTELRVHHILQFYSIPKMSKITGEDGKTLNQLVYRDVVLTNVPLEDGKIGNKVIKLVGKQDEAGRKKLEEELSVVEATGDETGTPTEALAIEVDTFYDYNFGVQIVKNSSYEKNQALDQSSRMEFANWRLGLAQVAPVNAPELVKWVEESYDVDSNRFEGQPGKEQQAIADTMNPQSQGNRPAEELARTDNTSALAKGTA